MLGADGLWSGNCVKIPDLIRNEDGFDYAAHGINEREKEIIRLIAGGNSTKEIAAELYLSEGTVRNYLSSILDKLQLRDRTQVAVFYYQHSSRKLDNASGRFDECRCIKW